MLYRSGRFTPRWPRPTSPRSTQWGPLKDQINQLLVRREANFAVYEADLAVRLILYKIRLNNYLAEL